MQPTFTDTLVDPAPPYTAATATARTEATASSYEMEEDDIFDFKFNDDAHTQPYLSLGLTPLSQLSPPDTGTTSNTGEYFFPSMPPPVTPLGSSVFSISGSSSSAGPEDSPFQLGNGNMMMPEANPVMGDSAIRRMGRRSKHETSMQSQGYAMKLEPVPEQSCSLDDSFRDVYHLNTESSSSSSGEDPSYQLLHPGMNNKLPTHLRRTTERTRRKSGTRRKTDEEEEEEIIIWNQGSEDFPVKLSREENSPRQEGRKLRQHLREQELARQKEKLQQKHLEEEKARLAYQKQRAAQIAQDYGSTHQREVNIDQMIPSHNTSLVLEQAMHFEAQAQLMQDSHHLSIPTHSSNKNEASNYIVNTSNQFSVL